MWGDRRRRREGMEVDVKAVKVWARLFVYCDDGLRQGAGAPGGWGVTGMVLPGGWWYYCTWCARFGYRSQSREGDVAHFRTVDVRQ